MRGSVGLLILRVGIGYLLMLHGWQKLIHFSELMETFPNPIGVGSTFSLVLAVFGEFFCSILVIVGLLTRFAAIPPIITMLVAIFAIHRGAQWGEKELAAVYLISFLTLIFTGAGDFSIDGFLKRK